MQELKGAALISHLRKQGKKFSSRKRQEESRKELERLQAIAQEHEKLTALDLLMYRMNAYAGIAKSIIAIAFYCAPCIVLGAVTVKAILWILL